MANGRDQRIEADAKRFRSMLRMTADEVRAAIIATVDRLANDDDAEPIEALRDAFDAAVPAALPTGGGERNDG